MTDFTEAYHKLNTRQRQAVDALDGPVLVVAGPGTGKTQLLSMRVANILKKTDTDPGSILCLTFTNKAASNMRDRLISLAGPEARAVTVKTFHSFAVEIINLYPEYFWNGAQLTAVPDAVQLEIINDILGKLPLSNPLALKFAGQFTQTGDVQQALKLAKEAGLTPEKLKALIVANLAYIDEVEPLLVEACAKTLSFKRLGELQAAIGELPDQPSDQLTAPLISLSTLLKDSLGTAIQNDEPTGKTTHTGAWKRRFVQSVAGKKGMHDERRRNTWWLALADVYAAYRDQLHGRGHYDYADMLVEVIAQTEPRRATRRPARAFFVRAAGRVPGHQRCPNAPDTPRGQQPHQRRSAQPNGRGRR